jgi:hypothetical protein
MGGQRVIPSSTMNHDMKVVTQGDVRRLQRLRGVLEEAGVEGRIMRPPGSGGG